MYNKATLAFLNQPAPVNYVAGLGRGATGFTTRSDIGPARMPSESDLPETFGKPQATPVNKPHDDDDDREDYSESNYDEFSGYGGSLYDATAPYEKDDEEADRVWASVDEKMDLRRKERREKRLREEMEKFRAEKPKIQQQFSDLKQNLAEVTVDEWEAIPEIGDHSQRFKQARQERYTPVPDSLLVQARSEAQPLTSIGGDTPIGATPIRQDLTAIGSARTTMMNMKLRQASDSVTGQTVVDPKNYLTDLRSMKVNTAAEITDIKRARLLLQSVTSTNPTHAPGWIAAARLEEVAGKLQVARKLIMQACDHCPKNEDVWLECARLHTTENAKIIYSRAVQHLPNSVKIWLAAANLESDIKMKKRVLRRGLELNSTSVRLWKTIVELEEPEDAKVLLARAVECVPNSVEMWLALAHLETYDNARAVLNKARHHIPTNPQIWITAAKLEEANGNEQHVYEIIRRAMKSLASHQVLIGREQWIKEAESCEKSDALVTCRAIIKESIGMEVEEEDRKATWLEDAESCLSHGSIETAKAILAHASTVFPNKKSIWLRIVHLEKTHGTKETLDQALKHAVQNCPQAEILWLMRAKEMWLTGNVNDARNVLKEAFKCNPNSEQIWLAAVKLESENREEKRARGLLEQARTMCQTKRVWMKSAAFEREHGDFEAAKRILDEGLQKFPKFDKLWMMRGQVEEKLLGEQDREAPHKVYQNGLKECPNSVSLWLCAAAWEEKAFSATRARALLEKARMHNPKNEDLWLHSIRVEIRANTKVGPSMLSKALQECPTSGRLWALSIALEQKPKQKSKSVDALKKCNDDPYVILAIAKLFADERRIEKARNWFNKAISLNPDLGDAWALYYRFELQNGTEEQRKAIMKRCVESEPHHGELWISVAKAVGNSRLTTEQILLKVVVLYENYDITTGVSKSAS